MSYEWKDNNKEDYLVAVDILKCRLGVTEKSGTSLVRLGESVRHDHNNQKKVRVLGDRN